VALTLIVLDISGIASTFPESQEAFTQISTIYVTRTVTEHDVQEESGAKPQVTSKTLPLTPPTTTTSTHHFHSTTSHVSTAIRSTSLVSPTVYRLESWILFVSLDPQPSFTASGIWRINETAVGVLLILVANFSAHQVPYRTILNLTITGPEIDQTIHQEELPLNGRIETRTTAYELTFNRVNPPPHARYLVSIYFQREDGKELKAQGWDTVNDQLYQDIQLTLQENPPWEG